MRARALGARPVSHWTITCTRWLHHCGGAESLVKAIREACAKLRSCGSVTQPSVHNEKAVEKAVHSTASTSSLVLIEHGAPRNVSTGWVCQFEGKREPSRRQIGSNDGPVYVLRRILCLQQACDHWNDNNAAFHAYVRSLLQLTAAQQQQQRQQQRWRASSTRPRSRIQDVTCANGAVAK